MDMKKDNNLGLNWGRYFYNSNMLFMYGHETVTVTRTNSVCPWTFVNISSDLNTFLCLEIEAQH